MAIIARNLVPCQVHVRLARAAVDAGTSGDDVRASVTGYNEQEISRAPARGPHLVPGIEPRQPAAPYRAGRTNN